MGLLDRLLPGRIASRKADELLAAVKLLSEEIDRQREGGREFSSNQLTANQELGRTSARLDEIGVRVSAIGSALEEMVQASPPLGAALARLDPSQGGTQALLALSNQATETRNLVGHLSNQLAEVRLWLEKISSESQSAFAHSSGGISTIIDALRAFPSANATLAQQIAEPLLALSNQSIETRNQIGHIDNKLTEISRLLEKISSESQNALTHLTTGLDTVREEARNATAHLTTLITTFTGTFGKLVTATDLSSGQEGSLGDDIFALDYVLPVGASVMHVEELARSIAAFAARKLNEVERFQLAERLAFAAYPQCKFSDFGRLFLKDRAFIETYKETMDPGNWHSLDRKYLVNEVLKTIEHVPGDFVECGVWKGATAVFLCRSAERLGRRVHLFDSWEGLPQPDSTVDGNHWRKGSLAVDFSTAIDYLKQFKCCTLYKGWIPERFPEVAKIKVSYLHIDVDIHKPTLDSLEFFYPRMSPGGIIICDDYGVETCPGATKALNDFFLKRPERIALLPTGQGLVIKQ
jgi:O-methyltransferase